MKKIAALEKLATEMIGDAGSPDLFFVTRGGAVVTITRNFQRAYDEWQSLTIFAEESALENRTFGVIASKEPDEVTGKLVVHDDSRMFKRH